MAQGLDLKNWDERRSSPPPSSSEAKLRLSAILKRTRSSTGSRRIFPPQFKLKVLDSYRNDVDCRGNQRATARKYNIHRRQIQKWLQCEENLRSSVGEAEGGGGRGPRGGEERDATTGRASKRFDSTPSGDGKADATLNRSAMIYARLSDAERSRDGNAVRPTLNPESGVYDRRDSSAGKLEAWNLKRVAQKLYPSSHVDAADGDVVERVWRPRDVEDAGSPPSASVAARDGNVSRVPGVPAEEGRFDGSERGAGRWNSGSGRTEDAPSRGRASPAVGEELRGGSDRPEEKYAGRVDGPECQEERKDSVWWRGSAETGCLPSGRTVCSEAPVSGSGDGASVGSDGDGGTSRVRALRCSDDSKSFSPKRKWMQESMQEVAADASREAHPTLPIKQRVKMGLKSSAGGSGEESAPAPRPASHNFTIEKLCASDIKSENPSPPSLHSPAESECYNWRADTCPAYPGYPLVSHSPLPRATLPFPPPLLFSHRVIPDLVSLHFKPDSPSELGSNSGARSCSPESVDLPSLKEEKVSDGEEGADVDVLGTMPAEKKAFDISGCNFGKRRSFSVQFKLTVLDAFYNDKDCNKNQRATARKFNINRRQVQKWLSQESDLRSEGSVKNGKYLQRQRLGNERESDGDEACKQCPQHCHRKRKGLEEVDKTIEVNFKHCTDGECLTRDKSSADLSRTPFSDGFEFYPKGCYPSDLKSANIYENYLLPENPTMICHNSFIGWPNLNTSALPVPNFHYLSPWYHNFDYCQEKSKIY